MDDEDSSLAKRLVSALVVVLLISAGLKVFEDLQNNPNVCQSSSQSTLDLSNLALLSFETSSSSESSQNLLNSSYWSMVDISYGHTIETLIPQTVVGFLQNSEAWKNWTMENMVNPPSWIDSGPISEVNQQLAILQSEAIGSTSSAQARGYITSFASSVSGYSLAALDYVTFNGLTSFKTLFETGNAEQALCTSFPGQLAQLYNEAFDSNESSQIRAQSLGTALAITSVMAILGGLGGFSDKFQVALAGSDLDGVWDTIKPSFVDLGSISPTAANLALVVLQELAERFPANVGTFAGFTSDRIDSMADVLQNDGDSVDAIDQKISGLIQAAENANYPDDVATDADVISYDDGGGIQVTFDDQNRMSLYSDKNTMQWIEASFLEQVVPGFKEGTAVPLKVTYQQKDVVVYHYYSGGNQWIPTAPEDVVRPGEKITVSFEILTRNAFIQSVPRIVFIDSSHFNWISDTSTLNFVQGGSPTDEIAFNVVGHASPSLGFGSASGMYLDIKITDVFDDDRLLRVYYDGYGSATIGISTGTKFAAVGIISFDGVRQIIVYEKVTTMGDYHEAVFYPTYPSGLYTFSDMEAVKLQYTLEGYSQSFFIDDVTTTRSIEYDMASKGSTADVARIGAEIAYTAATEELGLKNVVMIDPSQPGPDLYTQDLSVVIEARMLQRTGNEFGDSQTTDIQHELSKIIVRVQSDLVKYPTAQVGYVSFAYLDNDGSIHVIILEIPRTWGMNSVGVSS